MVKEIEREILGHLDWLVSRFKSLAVKFIGFVATCWLLIGMIWLGLVLPVSLVKGNIFKGNDSKVIVAKEALKKQANDYQMSSVSNRVNYQVPVVVRKTASQPVIRNEIRDVTNTLNELRRLGSGVESLVK